MDRSPLNSRETFADEVSDVVIRRERIASRVDELAAEIADHYVGREVTIVAALTGSLMFLADLLRRLPLRVRLEAVQVRSYPGSAVRSTGPTFTLPAEADLAGRDVLIVDDILDSGQTLEALGQAIRAAGAGTLRSCVLLHKRRDDLPGRAEADFVGFDIDDRFVVGYGLDLDGLYRNLPDLCLLRDASGEVRP